jgi:catechol 2,3-dioxygenase-like lactoylglutathione lyase family enzyme
MASLKIDHLNLLVSSLDASLPYYERLLELLGFKRDRKTIWSNKDGFFLQIQQAKPGTGEYERYGAGMNHLGFKAESAQEVHDIRQAMHDAGFEVPEIQDLDRVIALFMKDPDGIRFEISYYPPGTDVFD